MQIQKIDGPFPNLRIKKMDKEITLHSAYPHKEAERVVKHFNPNIPVVLIAGVGLGYIVEYLLSHTSYTILLYEHDDTFSPWNKDILQKLITHPRVTFFKGDSQAIFDYLSHQGIEELNLYIHRPYAMLFPQIYDNLHGMLVAYISRRQINQATARRFQKLWVRNVLKNSLFYFSLPGVKSLFGTAKGYPAVIIGAGPSLMKNSHLLQQAKEKNFILVATDTVLSYLDKIGVEADFVVSVDPQDKNALYLLSSKQKPYLILDSGASFLTFAQYPIHRIFLYDTILPFYRAFCSFWGEKGELQCGGSVSTTAYDFAYRLGCEPLIFVGQDLAYSSRQIHVPSNTLETLLYNTIDRFNTYEGYNATTQVFSDRIEVKAWDGKSSVLTDRKFLTFKEWFVRRIQEISSRTINATEGGSFIEGMEHLSFEKVLDTISFPSSPYKVPLPPPSFSSSQEFISTLKTILRDIHLLRSTLTREKPEEKLFAMVKEKPLFGRLIEMTMQESIQKLLSAKAIDESLVNQLRKEIREGIEFLTFMIEKRLLLEETTFS